MTDKKIKQIVIDVEIEDECMSESLDLCLSKREAEELFNALKDELKPS